jgi:phospholipid/cholesterol/gamma-HCH transport system substrate-binding protein
MSRTFSLGLFVAVTLSILAAGVFLIGRRQFLLNSTFRVKAEFQNVAGLTEGADVRVGGLHEGTVRRIDLPGRPDGRVTVVMDLDRSTREIVRKDSVAAIKSEGLLGDKCVEISFGSVEASRLADGESIGGEPPLEMAALIKKTDQILDSTRDTVENLRTTTEQLQSISAKVNQGKGTVGALINDRTVYQNASAGAAAFADDMEALKHNFLLRGYFKQRGYEDSSELARNEIPRLPPGPALKTFRYDTRQLFDKPDTAKLKKREALNNAGTFLETNPFGLAVVTSATGMRGDSARRRELTEAQAMVVRNYLAQNFRLDDTRLKTMGLGKTAQASKENTLEILVYPIGVNPPAERIQSTRTP